MRRMCRTNWGDPGSPAAYATDVSHKPRGSQEPRHLCDGCVAQTGGIPVGGRRIPRRSTTPASCNAEGSADPSTFNDAGVVTRRRLARGPGATDTHLAFLVGDGVRHGRLRSEVHPVPPVLHYWRLPDERVLCRINLSVVARVDPDKSGIYLAPCGTGPGARGSVCGPHAPSTRCGSNSALSRRSGRPR